MRQEYLDFLYNLGEFNIKLGLSTIGEMLARLGNPHHHPKIVHLAGTNGKGSTLSTLESLLIKSGFSTGSTVSPHLISYNERFRINGVAVDDHRLTQAFEAVRDKCGIPWDLSLRESHDGKIKPTFFEFSIAIAFLLFREAKVDYILLETGLGGRLDATNIVDSPLACAITRVAIDHQEFLGDSITEITSEKLGIVKKNSPVFISKQEDSVLEQALEFCERQAVDCYYYPKHFKHHAEDNHNHSIKIEYSLNDQDGTEDINKIVRYQKPGLTGNHQHENISLALALYYAVVKKSDQMAESEIARALRVVYWPGRMEYLGPKKNILIDGAHNQSGIRSLLSHLESNHSGQRVLFALGWMKGKNFIDIFADFDCEDAVFLPIQGKSERSETGEDIVRILTDKGYHSLPFLYASQLPEAIWEGVLPDHDLLVFSGSFYLIGEFLDVWQKREG